MNLYRELERSTAPPPKASAVRLLTAEEIEQLRTDGNITYVSDIPDSHICGREVVPPRWGRGKYGY